MEAFSLLKYWRTNAATNSGTTTLSSHSTRTTSGSVTTTIVTAVSCPQPTHTVAQAANDDDDDGPFFDLEFAVPEEDDESDDGVESTTGSEGGDRDFKLSLSTATNDDDDGDSLSPADDLFFKGTLVPIESSETNNNSSNSNLKPPQFPVSLIKSATKLRVFMLGFKKSKSEIGAKTDPNTNRSVTVSASVSPKHEQLKKELGGLNIQQQLQHESKFFTLKFKVEEVPIVSLFTRDSSKSASSNKLLQKHHSEESIVVSDQDKSFSKEVVHKYLKKVKPLYVRVSKLKFPGQLNLKPNVQQTLPPVTKSKIETQDSVAPTEATPASKHGNIPTGGLRVVRKHLGKSRSASSSVAAAPAVRPASSKRRDDSLLQQEDGIQSAIQHCKRSFNATRDSENSGLSRCVSDSLNEKKSTDS